MTKEEQIRERREGWIHALQWAEKYLRKQAQSCFNDNNVYAGNVVESCASALRKNYVDVVVKMIPRDKGGDMG